MSVLLMDPDRAVGTRRGGWMLGAAWLFGREAFPIMSSLSAQSIKGGQGAYDMSTTWMAMRLLLKKVDLGRTYRLG